MNNESPFRYVISANTCYWQVQNNQYMIVMASIEAVQHLAGVTYGAKGTIVTYPVAAITRTSPTHTVAL